MTSHSSATPAILVLADGHVYRGRHFGAEGNTLGEAVFTTAMTGYQETLTDPSYHKQIVVATAPQIGNTGWNDEDGESHGDKIWVAGLAIRDLSSRVSSWRAERSLEEELKAQGVVGICGIDTRAVVRHLRNFGSIAAGIFTGEKALAPVEELLDEVKSQPAMAGADLAEEVSTQEPYVVEPEGKTRCTVVAYDMGVKTNSLRNFSRRGIKTYVVPANTPFEDITQYQPDGVFVSNGPGDPATADTMVGIVRDILRADLPFFGICFGNQIFGRALGLDTYKLTFGHRGINVPVIETRTGTIDITAQNHGFALQDPGTESFETDFGPAYVSHRCLNDGVVEGVALESGRAFSVQYHPEAAAGPHDANSLFDRFIQLIERSAESATAQEGE